MSLSWLDRLSLYVHPRRVVLERRSWRGAVCRQVLDTAPPAAGGPDWQPALAAVAGVLAADGRRGGRAAVVVADHFVRYAVLPWSDEVSGEGARRAVAQALLRNALGERAEGLEIALDRPRFRQPGLAAGIERAFLDELRAVLRRQHIVMTSLQPRLVRELAAGRRQLGSFDGWFVSAEAERLTLAGIAAGSLVALRNQRVSPDSLTAELSALLAADCQREPGGKLFVCTAGGLPLPVLPPPWEIVAWPSALPGGAHA